MLHIGSPVEVMSENEIPQLIQNQAIYTFLGDLISGHDTSGFYCHLLLHALQLNIHIPNSYHTVISCWHTACFEILYMHSELHVAFSYVHTRKPTNLPGMHNNNSVK